MALDEKTAGSAPRYRQILDALRERAAELVPGAGFGTEAGYARQFGVSRPTIRRAVDVLVDEGLVVRVPGVGLQTAPAHLPESRSRVLVMVSLVDVEDGLFSECISGAVDALNQAGLSYLIQSGLGEDERLDFLHTIDLSAYRGVILTAFDTPADRACIALLQQQGVPFVLVDNPLRGGLYSYVVADDYAGGFLVGEHLAALGHKRVLYIRNGSPAETTRARLAGLRDALRAHGVEHREQDAARVDYEDAARGYIMEKLCSPGFDYTAIVCSNDLLAAAVASALDEAGVDIPGQISLTGYGDSRIAGLLRRPLTTVHMPGYQMGFQAARQLCMGSGAAGHKKVILEVSLVVRQSTGWAPK